MKEKSDLQHKVMCLIKDLKEKYGLQVKKLRCDNAGENQTLEAQCKDQGLGVIFEYTDPGTPQQNGRVERKFQTLYDNVRAMLNGGEFTKSWRNMLWAEFANTATALENNLVAKAGTLSPFQQLFGKGAKSILKSIKKFGEICIVKSHDQKLQNKLSNCGKQCIWVGYAA